MDAKQTDTGYNADFNEGVTRNVASSLPSGGSASGSVSPGQRARQFHAAWRDIMTAYKNYWQEILNRIETDTLSDLSPPKENERIKRAHTRWIELLRQSPQGDPFPALADRPLEEGDPEEDDLHEGDLESDRLFEIHPTLGIVQIMRSIPVSAENGEDENVQYEDVVDWQELVVQAVTVDVLTRLFLTELPLEDLPESELTALAEYFGSYGSELDADALRSQSMIVRRKKPQEGLPTKQNTGQQIMNLERFRSQEVPLLNFNRLRPSPLNLVRFYRSGRATDTQREQIAYAVTGWVTACAKTEYVTGQSKQIRSTSSKYFDTILSYVLTALHEFPLPPFHVQQVRTQNDFFDLLSAIQTLGGAQAALWAYLFTTRVVSDMGHVEKLRQGIKSKPKQPDQPDAEAAAKQEVKKSKRPKKRLSKSPLAGISEWEVRERAMAQIKKDLPVMSKQEQQAYLKREVEKKSLGEIAEELGIRITTVKTLLSRARKRAKGDMKRSSRKSKPRSSPTSRKNN
jgi:DNA-directed RNA polymerase specialized sigma24 family protein